MWGSGRQLYWIYLLYYILNKILLNYYSIKQIIVNVYILSAIIVFFLFNKDFFITIDNLNEKYILIILLAFTIISTNLILTYTCKKNINFGKVEGIAMGIYIPFVTIISYYFFNNEISFINYVGLFFIGIGVFLSTK